MKKRIISFLCAFLLLLCLCACSKGDESTPVDVPIEDETTQANEDVSEKIAVVPFTTESSLNPYKTNSMTNRYLLNLVFDPLFRLSEAYEPVSMIGSSYEIDGNTLTVELRDDIVFSNGEYINARDVIYSYQQAKSSPLYSQRLSNFYSCTSSGSSIIFNITDPDIFAASCLDFPIVKFGSAVDKIPTGSGRYIIKKSKGTYSLIKNESYVLSDEMEQTKIELLDLNTVENELYLLQIGELSCIYNDPNGSKENKIIANKQQIALNNLVYLGINSFNGELSDVNVRNAISYAIDNATIADNAYDGLARSCKSPFNPSWSKAAVFENNSNEFDMATANSLLEKSGYIYAYKNNKYRSKNFEYIKLDLIVNKESPGKVTCAKLIKTQLETIGIDTRLYALDYDSYISRLKSNDFDLYIGEVKLTPNMDLSIFFSKNGKASYGIDSKSPVCSAYKDFKSGNVDISTFNKVFYEVKPFIPLCYRDANVYYSRALEFEDHATESDIYSNIYSWSF